jgi:hypothetical protein
MNINKEEAISIFNNMRHLMDILQKNINHENEEIRAKTSVGIHVMTKHFINFFDELACIISEVNEAVEKLKKEME